uniref:DET1 homolog n=1 Tax=Ciona intestinalis TaxID=7719 RepID=UPI000180BD81|nr:DET1 homolog [Ciona intestinalis]|eukprot:XP_002124474.1 DET1 homolog [Ciona intestinalis]
MEVPDLLSVSSSKDGSTIPMRKFAPQNIVYRIKQREISTYPCGSTWSKLRKFHQCIIPNFTVVNVGQPPCYLRKFSPDGKYFIVFSADQTFVEVYEYQGCHAAEKMLRSLDGNELHENSGGRNNFQFKEFYQKIREKLFSTFFIRKHQISVAMEGHNLNRECSLFTDDGRYVIVVSAGVVPTNPQPPFYDIYSNNESMSPNPRHPLEDYSIHCVGLVSGVLQSSVHFKCDKIFPSHNQGLYLYKNILSVLSVQHQTIHIFCVVDGQLVQTHKIGRFCFDDDDMQVASHSQQASDYELRRPFHDVIFNSLKHRLLAYLYKDAARRGNESIQRFYQHFDFFEDLRIWRMQLLDEDHLLIKYASVDVVGIRIQEPNAQPSCFVVYNFRTAQVLAVYENTSHYLLKIFEDHPGIFRQADAIRGQHHTACPDVYSSQIQQRFKDTIVNAKYGGNTEAVKRLLAQLPIPAQSHSPSPYLDLALFSFDDKWVSSIERPKSSSDYPIRFYSRDSGLLKFQIRAGMMSGTATQSSSQRRLVAFTFHPHEPFAISVQRINVATGVAEYVVNFHFRHFPLG